MATQLLTQNIDDQTRKEATEVIQELHNRAIVETVFRLDDGSEIALPKNLSDLMVSVLQSVTQGDLRIQSIPDERTTRTASELLGVSRPTLTKMVKDGLVPSHQVGTHHRFHFTDIAELIAKREAERSEALDQLLDLELEHRIED